MNIFDQHLATWKQMQTEPWMRLRYELASVYLQQHLPPAPARILDIGGGNGFDSIPLARAGYHVTIVDASTGMLDDARAYAQTLGITGQITFIHGSIETLPTHIPATSIDVVFCHNVLQYVEAPAQAAAALRDYLIPGGILSIINPTPASEALRIACQTYNLAEAAASINTMQHYAPTFDVVVQRYTVSQVGEWIKAAGCELIAQYGIRCICDYLGDNDRKRDPAFYADLYALEQVMGMIDPYRQIARFMHLVARRV